MIGQELLARNLSLNMQRHCYAVAAIMEGLAKHYNEDPEPWYLAGMLHDIDYEHTAKDLSQHSKLAAQWLEEGACPAEIVRAVLVHNEGHGLATETRMERALIFADALSGLVVASALVLPDKKIAELKTKSVLKKFKQKDFAAGVHREEILLCEKDGLNLEQFVEIAIASMNNHSEKIGL